MNKQSRKRYKCRRCGHVVNQTTNHYGSTWSWGRVNTCPKCPPWAKYPEYGSCTYWDCIDKPQDVAREEFKLSSDWKHDPWGECLNHWFDVAEVLYTRGVTIPQHWEYHPGAGEDIVNNEQYLTMNDDELIAWGNVLERYTRLLRAAGKDY